jgi:hypothetical protein
MLENGHILVFNNGVERKYSSVVELDPVTKVIVWEYLGGPAEDFYSDSRGSAQRFPNGNTLICESNEGRTFEVTAQGEVVWQWLNVLKKKRRNPLSRMERLSPTGVEKLMKGFWRWWEYTYKAAH